MAPVVASLVTLLALAGAVDAKPLLTPGRHAPPSVANVLAHSRRSFHKMMARYYGDSGGLTKPPPLPEKRAVSLPSGWTDSGCAEESNNQRLLTGFSFSSSSLTPLTCIAECSKRGFSMAGTEYGDECYCGNTFQGSGGKAASGCSRPCGGDPSSVCGDSWRLTIYTYNQTSVTACAPTTSPVTPSAGASYSTKSASSTASVSASSTVSSAAEPSSTRPVHVDEQDSSEWYSLGCAMDSSTRILTGFYNGGDNKNTVDNCLSLCEDKGYAFAGVEYGVECYCGNSVPTTITYSDTACNVPCPGDKTEDCGGGWALDLYELISSANATDCPVDETTTSLTVGNAITIPTTFVGSSAGSALTSGAVSSTKSAASTAVAASSVVAGASATSAAAQPTTVPSSSNDHVVWAHHMVGNTYPYGKNEWLSDIKAASSYGIDGFALNLGHESWQADRAADAYSAASSSGTGFKLFLSLDMTSLSCSSAKDATNLVNLVKRFARDPAQAMHNGKVLVSTFAGSDCQFGTGSSHGWQSSFVDALTKQGVNIFFVPSLFSDVSTFSSNTWMDGELNWNSGWPSGGNDLASSSTDSQYMAALGGKEYMPAISPFFYTHFGQNSWNKNWLYRGDDWLYCTRWEQVIAMRQSVKMTEILTWNDYGESSYIGPIAGALPSGSNAWVDGFDHDSINVLTKYYATAFKTGSYPKITEDTIIMWSRPHPRDATATSDSVGKPTGWDWTDDNIYAIVLSQSDAIVQIKSGSTTKSFSVSSGLTKLKMASSNGAMSAQMTRGGKTVTSYSSAGAFQYTDKPQTYNYNYMVGSSS